jgi:site-specific recombinase XerC
MAVPPELEWYANIRSEKTRRVYRNNVKELSRFLWRTDLEQRNLAAATIRRKLASISSLFDYLCEQNAVLHNPVLGMKRPQPTTTKARRLPLVTAI